MRAGKIRGYHCDHAYEKVVSTSPAWHLVDSVEAEVVYAGYNVIARNHFSINFPKDRGWGPLTLVQCCKQMYLEAIDLLYSKRRSFPSSISNAISSHVQVCKRSHLHHSHHRHFSCKACFLIALPRSELSNSATIISPCPVSVRVTEMIDAFLYMRTRCRNVRFAFYLLGRN